MINQTEEIKVVIAKDGSVKIEGVGFAGPACTEATKFLEEQMGAVDERTLKPEYHKRPVSTIKQRQAT